MPDQDLEQDCGCDESAGDAIVPAAGRLPLQPVRSEVAGRGTCCSTHPPFSGSVCSRNLIGHLSGLE